MTPRKKRIGFYLALAITCYSVAIALDKNAAAGVFLCGGILGELFFWKAVIWS